MRRCTGSGIRSKRSSTRSYAHFSATVLAAQSSKDSGCRWGRAPRGRQLPPTPPTPPPAAPGEPRGWWACGLGHEHRRLAGETGGGESSSSRSPPSAIAGDWLTDWGGGSGSSSGCTGCGGDPGHGHAPRASAQLRRRGGGGGRGEQTREPAGLSVQPRPVRCALREGRRGRTEEEREAARAVRAAASARRDGSERGPAARARRRRPRTRTERSPWADLNLEASQGRGAPDPRQLAHLQPTCRLEGEEWTVWPSATAGREPREEPLWSARLAERRKRENSKSGSSVDWPDARRSQRSERSGRKTLGRHLEKIGKFQWWKLSSHHSNVE